MVLVKVLERKDAASLIVAIAGGVVLSQVLLTMSNAVIGSLLESNVDFSLKSDILEPLLVLVLAFAVLEGLARLVIALRSNVGSR